MAQNVVNSGSTAGFSGSTVGSDATPVGSVAATATSDGRVKALVLNTSAAVAFAKSAAVGVAVGVGVARNFIGSDPGVGAAHDLTTDDRPTAINPGDRVKVLEGPLAGDVYRYVGQASANGGGIELAGENFGDARFWELVSAGDGASEVRAYLSGTRVVTSAAFDLTAVDRAAVEATVVGVAVALAPGKAGGVAVGAAGVYSENRIGTDIQAVVGGAASGVTAGSARLVARDEATITAVAAGGSVAASFAKGGPGVSVALGVTVASNRVANTVEASAAGFDHGFRTTGGGVELGATSTGSIRSTAVAASLAVGVSKIGGVGVAGAGAFADNLVTSNTNAFVANGTVTSAGDVRLGATNTSAVSSLVVSTSLAVGLGQGAVGVAIGAAAARNRIGDTSNVGGGEVQAYTAHADVTASGTIALTSRAAADIDATVQAGALAAAAGTSLLSISAAAVGAGAYTGNEVAHKVRSVIGSGVVTAQTVRVTADDESSITSDTGAIAVAANLGLIGASATLGLAIADNAVGNTVEALVGPGAVVTATAGPLVVTAGEFARADATTTSASGALAISLGFSATAAVTVATNAITSTVYASVQNSTAAADGVQVAATYTPTLGAETKAIAVGVGLVSFGVGVVTAANDVGGNVAAFLADSQVTATGAGDVTVTASTRPTLATDAMVGAVAFGLSGAGAGGGGTDHLGRRHPGVHSRGYRHGHGR